MTVNTNFSEHDIGMAHLEEWDDLNQPYIPLVYSPSMTVNCDIQFSTALLF